MVDIENANTYCMDIIYTQDVFGKGSWRESKRWIYIFIFIFDYFCLDILVTNIHTTDLNSKYDHN